MGPTHRAAAAPLGIGLAVLAPWGTLADAGGETPYAPAVFALRVGERLGGTVDGFAGTSVAAWVATVVLAMTEAVMHFGLGLAVVGCSKWNDLDHPRFKGRMHLGAWAVRLSARIGYSIHTKYDRVRNDLHRGPSHCLEWCALVGLLCAGISARVPWLAPWALWWGLAIFLGTASHVFLDAMTPSGVPVSAVWNFFRYREVWRRHTLSWKRVAVRLPWPMAESFVAVAATPVDGGGQVFGEEDRPAATPATLPALIAFALVPGVRATTSLRLALHSFRVPWIGILPGDERAPDGCEKGLVTTDTGAEHLVMVPILWTCSAVAFLAVTGLLAPVWWWLTNGTAAATVIPLVLFGLTGALVCFVASRKTAVA